jgi:tetratricopeptide (TPR) repeat protein
MVADDAEAWIEKGDRLKVEGLIVEALDCYVRAREIAPDDVEAWTSEGFCLQELGQSASAVACFNSAMAADPSDVDLRMCASHLSASPRCCR